MRQTIIYGIFVEGILRYVGSSFENRFESRCSCHLRKDEWLKPVQKEKIEFRKLEICNGFERFNRESYHWKLAVDSGILLENKRDPLRTWPLLKREAYEIANETRKRNKTQGNGGKIGGKKSKGKKNYKLSLAKRKPNPKLSMAQTGNRLSEDRKKRIGIAVSKANAEKRSIIENAKLKGETISWEQAAKIRRDSLSL